MKMLKSGLWAGVLGVSLLVGCAAGTTSDGEDTIPGSEGQGGSSGAEGGSAGTTSEAGAGGSEQAGQGGSDAGSGGSDAGSGGSDAGSGGTAGGGGSNGGSGGSDAGAGGSGGSNGGSGGAAGCGDGKKGDKEQCDGADLGGQTCASALDPSYGGKLGCKSNCQLDFSGCAKNPVCGDGAINVTGEECDDSDFGGKTCAQVLNKPSATGALTCTASCKIDSSNCKQGPFCGDGKKGDTEDCDGDDLGTATCASATGDPNKGGFLACKADCKVDTAGCVDNPKCGDGKVNNVGEQCDGNDLVGASCKSALGNQNATGTLACKGDCQFDTAGCTIPPYCGDGKKGASEGCDGNDFGGATCESVLGQGHVGQLFCSVDCTISSAQCEKVPFCGDGVKNGADACDGGDIGGATCASVVGPGSTGGLACKADCSFDVGACSIPPSCGNGAINADKGEQCDGSLFGGATCATLLGDSKAIGSLVCTSACTIDSSGCSIPPYCGDGKLNQASEECDDGNTTSGDGCNGSCKVVCLGSEQKLGVNCYIDSWNLPSGEDYKSWDAAEAYCVGGGGHLVSISSKVENDFIYYDVMPSGFFDPTSPRWIGLNDKVTEGSFAWSSSEPVSYTNWRSGEPSNSGGNEDCAEQRWSDGQWNDGNCTQTRLFVCEYPPPVLFP